MSHKTLVNGTVYEVDGGKTLIDGVAYSIDKGKTLVGGTAYEVGFSNIPLITIVNAPSIAFGTAAYLKTSDSQELQSGTYEFPIGTVITCWVGGDTGYVGKLIINGETVLTVDGSTGFLGPTNKSYDYTVTCDATIAIQNDGNATDKNRKGTITITED